MVEERCDSCGEPLGTAPQRWKRTIPVYEIVNFCGDCAARLPARASEWAASDDDELRIRGMTATLAGEVWQSPTTLYWYRDPIVLRQKPAQAAPAPTLQSQLAPKAPKKPKREAASKRAKTRAPAPRGSKKPKREAASKRAKPHAAPSKRAKKNLRPRKGVQKRRRAGRR